MKEIIFLIEINASKDYCMKNLLNACPPIVILRTPW